MVRFGALRSADVKNPSLWRGAEVRSARVRASRALRDYYEEGRRRHPEKRTTVARAPAPSIVSGGDDLAGRQAIARVGPDGVLARPAIDVVGNAVLHVDVVGRASGRDHVRHGRDGDD